LKVFVAIRVIRLLRVFRILRVGRYSTNLKIIAITLRRSMDALFLLLFLVWLLLVICSTLLFFCEQYEAKFENNQWIRGDGSVSPFQSIPATFWWCIATITTTGYGDQLPITWIGKVVAGITMLIGVMTVAFPISIIGANFNSIWFGLKQRQRMQRRDERRKLERATASSSDRQKYDQLQTRELIEIVNKTSFELSEQINGLVEKQKRLEDLIFALKNSYIMQQFPSGNSSSQNFELSLVS